MDPVLEKRYKSDVYDPEKRYKVGVQKPEKRYKIVVSSPEKRYTVSMLKRTVTQKLLEWKENPQKKALLIDGARQIGKTFIIREFAKEHYTHFVELNFLLQPQSQLIFEKGGTAAEIITGITAFSGASLVPGKTLIFLDEIQECPMARMAVKTLVQDGRFDYIESGSLLGIHYKEVPSYPVGYEEELTMYPMGFGEFCSANGVGDETIPYLRN